MGEARARRADALDREPPRRDEGCPRRCGKLQSIDDIADTLKR